MCLNVWAVNETLKYKDSKKTEAHTAKRNVNSC